jgi:hypothetical protein
MKGSSSPVISSADMDFLEDMDRDRDRACQMLEIRELDKKQKNLFAEVEDILSWDSSPNWQIIIYHWMENLAGSREPVVVTSNKISFIPATFTTKCPVL